MEIGSYSADQDQVAATRADGQTRVRVYRPDETLVVLGRGSKPELELHSESCEEDGVPVLRRTGGGCAVVLDPGNVIVSLAAHAPGLGGNQAWFDRISAWLIAGLETLGVAGVRQAGISDLALGDRKFGGACLHRARDTLHYSVSLLVEPDLAAIDRYLQHPPREPDYRQGRTHRDFLTSLGVLSEDLATAEAVERLGRHLRPEIP